MNKRNLKQKKSSQFHKQHFNSKSHALRNKRQFQYGMGVDNQLHLFDVTDEVKVSLNEIIEWMDDFEKVLPKDQFLWLRSHANDLISFRAETGTEYLNGQRNMSLCFSD